MKLLPKLILVLLSVSLVPVVISGYSLIGVGQRVLKEKIDDLYLSSAQHIADDIGKTISEIVRNLRLGVGYTNFGALSDDEKVGALRILYSQFDSLNIITLLDERGREVVPSVFIDDPKFLVGPLKGHQAVSPEELTEYSTHIPFAAARESGTALGSVYISPIRKTPAAAVALSFPVKNRKEPWVLSAEVSLTTIQNAISKFVIGKNGNAFLVDGEGRIVAHPDMTRVISREDLSNVDFIRSLVRDKKMRVARFSGDNGTDMIGASAPVKELSWGVVVQQPRTEALFAVRQMRARVLYWLGASLAATVIVGVILAGGISRPVVQCAEGANQIAQGNYDQRIHVETRDEMAQLASSFNHMAGKLKESIDKIERQNDELRAWNVELEKRVKERTQELKETQEQLLQSKKMSAIRELAAGVAHELNNPLVGILGIAQLILMKRKGDDEEFNQIATLEKEARRCSEIVRNLLRFTQSGGIDEGTFTKLDLNVLLERSILLAEKQFPSAKVSFKRSFSPGLPLIMGRATDIQQVILNLISNAHNAMPEGGEIALSTSSDDSHLVKAVVSDTGRGIPPENMDRIFEPFFTTKDRWDAKGLGLSVAYRIVEEHKGKILVKSEPGKGTTFTLVFPSAPKTQLV